MKTMYVSLTVLFCLTFGIINANPVNESLLPGNIKVYYFHYERRCATCVAVEEETKKALNELYGSQMKKGKISFQSVNLEEKSGEQLADKLKIAGQSLVIVNGNNVIDITDKAFMYAKSEPAKLKAEIRKQIDEQLK